MPLFKSHPEPEPVAQPPARKGSIFARNNRSVSPEPVQNTNHNRGFFGRRRSSDESSLGHPSSGNSVRSGTSGRAAGGGLFGGNNFNVHKDPTVLAAREKLGIAEKAEAAADAALLQARAMVKEAKEHVRFLEREAAEEHKRAKAKQAVANDVSRSAAGLGRHGT
ncbi:hypothetical protein DFH08DRAFT_961264 [Mycena albidolilacea]|uniref:Uncharacterized protein n=1 Tax=Mycena albidolilacea TaxID=1033008 RepID=A0AAD7A122_9AGAR|nr:hypothetical protein DFH08DRAFT_961264 [Mycena albidolilacea]